MPITRSRSYGLFLTLISLLLPLSATTARAALDANQEAQLGAIKNHIRLGTADVAAARSTAGTAEKPATGSRLKLTRLRLDQASERLKAASAALAKLPADDAAVKEVAAMRDAMMKDIADIEAILSGDAKPAPPPTTTPEKPATPTPAPTKPTPAPRLGYKDEEKLKNARFYLREVDGYIANLNALVKRLDGEGEPVVHSQVELALNTLANADKKFGYAAGYLNDLDATHPMVVPVATSAADAKNSLGALRSRLTAAEQQLGKLTDMANYPKLNDDYELMQGFIRRYYDFELSVQRPKELVTTIAEDGRVMAEVQRIAKAYQPLVDQKTEPGKKIENRVNYFLEKRTAFVAAAQKYKAELPGLIDADIAEAMNIAQQGVQEQKPLFFGEGSGIEQRLEWAAGKTEVLAGFDADAAKPSQAKLAAARVQIDKMADSLARQIIDSNKPSPDRYTGDDRQALIDRALDGWKHQQSDAQLLGAVIPSEAWQRETKWQWFNGAFYKVDRSKLQVQLLIAHDNELAVVRPMNMIKDHLKGDTVIAVPLFNIKEKIQPWNFVRRDRLK